MSIRDANAVSRTTAEYLSRVQGESVAGAPVPPAEPGAPRWAWVVLDTRVEEGLEDDEEFIPALYTGHVVTWWGANVETYNAPEQRRITADDTCLVYFAQMMPAQVSADSVLELPVAFCAMQTGSRDGVPMFVVPGAFHLDRLSLGDPGDWGDTLYREEDDWKRLPIGTAGKVLTAKTVSGHVVPSWEAPASGPTLAWCAFSGSGGAVSGVVSGSLIPTVTRMALGYYSIAFPLASSNMSAVASGCDPSGYPVVIACQPSLAVIYLVFRDESGTDVDPSYASVMATW